MSLSLEELLRKGEVEAALIWDEALGLSPREIDLVRRAWEKGLELGKQVERARADATTAVARAATGDPELTPEAVELAALLLMAADNALAMDASTPGQAVEQARMVFLSLHRPEWADGKHQGDCTKAPHTCSRCLVERYVAEARRRWDED